MKLIQEEKDEYIEAVKIECTPAEYLVLNQAMRLYMENDYVNETDRDIMRRMLEAEPTFKDTFMKNLFKNTLIFFITAIITEAVIWWFFLK